MGPRVYTCEPHNVSTQKGVACSSPTLLTLHPSCCPVGNGHLDAAALQHLQSLTVLSRLTISSSSLTNADLTAVCSALPQLQSLDAGNNRITKADTLTGLVSLTSLNLSRNPLQLNCSKVLAALPLQALALFDAVPARAVSQLAGSAGSVLTQQLTSLTLGADPTTNAEGTDEGLQLAKTRTCGVLFGALAEAARLQVCPSQGCPLFMVNISCWGFTGNTWVWPVTAGVLFETCGVLFGALAEAARLQVCASVISVQC